MLEVNVPFASSTWTSFFFFFLLIKDHNALKITCNNRNVNSKPFKSVDPLLAYSSHFTSGIISGLLPEPALPQKPADTRAAGVGRRCCCSPRVTQTAGCAGSRTQPHCGEHCAGLACLQLANTVRTNWKTMKFQG